MTGSLPQQLEGAQGPNALELLWERNRGLVRALFWLIIIGYAAYYGIRYYNQKELNAKWSAFAAASLLRPTYSPEKVDPQLGSPYEAVARILDEVKGTPTETFDKAIAAADPSQKPFLLWIAAVHYAQTGNAEAAQKAADRLVQEFPKHPLVSNSPYPVQVREPVKNEKGTKEPQPDKEPELQPALPGSSTEMLVAQLKAAKEFMVPSHFAKPAIPADAPKYRFTFDGDYGSFVVALMVKEAPKHCAKFQELAEAKYWEGVRVDEIARPGKVRWSDQVWQIHFGFESTKTEANSSDWDTTAATKEERTVEEISSLSHFEGAVAARNRDGKSEMDRLFVCASDCATSDESRQVFAYVIEGLEAVKRVCQADFAKAEDADVGRGLPDAAIKIKSVEKL